MERGRLSWRKLAVVMALALGAARALSMPSWELMRGPAGVTLELDRRMPFPVPRPEDLPLVRSGEANLADLVDEGRHQWFFDAPLEGEPFGVPAALFDLHFGNARGLERDRLYELFEVVTRTGLVHVPGEELPRGIVRTRGQMPLITQNCSACHSGVVENQLIPGIGNKWYNQEAIIDHARNLMRASVPLLLAQGPAGAELLRETRRQMAKLERYDALYGRGCRDLAPGMITAARIWQISSKLLHDPAQLATTEGLQRFMCGATKPPPLNTLRFRNLLFWDGSVNSLWVAHWPMFDFFGFDDYDRWDRKVRSREIQALDAFVVFGTRSPSWEEVMGTPVRKDMAARGHELFHRANSCASCHGIHDESGMLRSFRPTITPLKVIRTDEERAVAAFDELMQEFAQYGWAYVPRLDGYREYDPGYTPMPLCSPFLNFPYLHTGAVGSLYELLLPEEERQRGYIQSDVVDKVKVGYFAPGRFPQKLEPRAKPPRILPRNFRDELVRGHSGARFGTTMSTSERWDLLEYLKTLRCPEEEGVIQPERARVIPGQPRSMERSASLQP
ncbi:MAG: hypothetical protein AB2A00_16100 [Myxococcota bacterium]